MSQQPTPARDARQQSRQHSIDYLRREFRLNLGYIPDPELKAEVTEWLKRADQLPATTVLEYVERKLSDLRARPPNAAVDNTDGDTSEEAADDGTDVAATETVSQYDMYRSGDDGEVEFPDACEGCPHYGTRCPVFCSPTELTRRSHFQRNLPDATPARVKQKYREFATYNECHRIPAYIREYEDAYQSLTNDGWELLKHVNRAVDVGYTDEQADAARAVADAHDGSADQNPAAAPDGGSIDG